MLKSMLGGKERTHLDIERIREIKTATNILLTLHGGSGTADQDLKEAIGARINIVHINTELRLAWKRGLESSLTRSEDEIAPYKLLPPAVASVQQVVSSGSNSLTTWAVARHNQCRPHGKGVRLL